MKDKIARYKELRVLMDKYSRSYYDENISLVSDKEFDELFDEAKRLKKEIDSDENIIEEFSPTDCVGYMVLSELKKVKHNHPMLSLDKTKDIEVLKKFCDKNPYCVMPKLDGLTVSLRYVDGKLVSAETRGNGEIGEDILHNALVFSNVPHSINYKEELVIDGEAIISYDIFDQINSQLLDDEKYSNPRNLASGSVRQLDSSIAAKRNIKFVAWKLVKGFEEQRSHYLRLDFLNKLGFETVMIYAVLNKLSIDELHDVINQIKTAQDYIKYPIDGIVAGYDDIDYCESLGSTSHHVNSQLAFKFYDEEYETRLLDVEWQIGKTGVVTPVAVFEPTEIDGAIIRKCSLHNVSIFENLDLHKGDIITVYKANQIIPAIGKNLSIGTENRKEKIMIPKLCKECNSYLRIKNDNNTKFLHCENNDCKGIMIAKLNHFVSRDAMNIIGLSVKKIIELYNAGLLKEMIDLYSLSEHIEANTKSNQNLLNTIEVSRNTTLERFLYALSIPSVGKSLAKDLAKHFVTIENLVEQCAGLNMCLLNIDGISTVTSNKIKNYINLNKEWILKLANVLEFNTKTNNVNDNKLSGMSMAITGSFNKFSNRKDVIDFIESHGGAVCSSVTKNTTHLLNNDVNSNSSKNKKAKELGIKIITEDDLLGFKRTK